MKGKQMSAILAILLMLSGIVAFVPRAFAVATADSVGANPAAVNYTYPAQGPGTIFTVYVDVVNVDNLFAFQVGFYFDQNYLQVNSVNEGGFLSSGGAILSFPGTIDNVNGVVTSYGYTLQDTTKAVTGSGHLLTVVFEVLPTLFPPVTPGSVPMMTFSFTNELDPAFTKLIWNDAVTVITVGTYIDGTFSLTATPTPPVAAFAVTPLPPNYVGDLLTFDGSASLPGSNGYSPLPIVSYEWNFGDGNITTTAGPIVTHSYSASGAYAASLIVTDSGSQVSTPAFKTINILVRPTGCVLDVYVQSWRYIDPFTYTGALQGKGPNLPATLFRPGDLVQVFIMTAYNGDPVGFQFVAIQVLDPAGNTVLTGNILTNASGFGELDFRIPWPQDVNNPGFGAWTIIATWEVGSNTVGIPPGSITQVDTLTFPVGWGVWSSDLRTVDILGNPVLGYFKGDTVYVEYKLHNDYTMPIEVVNGVTIYDDLMVPIGFNFVQVIVPANSVVTETVPITIPTWAFVGVGTVKANEYSAFPSANGIAFGPEQLTVFQIKHTFTPIDP